MSPSTRMPRRERRAQLLDLATAVFTDQGYQGTSMDDIARAAGVTKPVLYQHFASKEALYSEVIGVLGENLLREAAELTRYAGTPVERVRYGQRRFYELVSLENTLRLFTGKVELSEPVQARVDAVLDALALELASVVTAFREISEEEARIVGHAIIGITQVSATLQHEAPDEVARERVLDTITTTIAHGLSGFTLLREEALRE